MYEDEVIRGGVGTAKAARCGNGGKGAGGLARGSGGGTVDDKVGEDDERDARASLVERTHLASILA